MYQILKRKVYIDIEVSFNVGFIFPHLYLQSHIIPYDL